MAVPEPVVAVSTSTGLDVSVPEYFANPIAQVVDVPKSHGVCVVDSPAPATFQKMAPLWVVEPSVSFVQPERAVYVGAEVVATQARISSPEEGAEENVPDGAVPLALLLTFPVSLIATDD